MRDKIFCVIVALSLIQEEPKKEEKKDDSISKVVTSGLKYLVMTQSKDGSFDDRGGYFNRAVDTRPAVTALALLACEIYIDKLEKEDKEQVRSMMIKAQKWLFSRKIQTGHVDNPFHESKPWNNLYTLQYLLYVNKKDSKDEEKRVKLEKYLSALESNFLKEFEWRKRKLGGGWGYSPGSHGADSFLTAPIIITLLECKEVGFKISDETLAKGIKFLKKMRKSNGVFMYGDVDFGGDEKTKRWSRGSCARDALCELALYLAGESSQENLQWAISNFFQYRDDLENARANIPQLHGGPGGTSYHYFYFSHFYILQALHYLDSKSKLDVAKDKQLSQVECVEKIKKAIVEIQCEDGSWNDATKQNHKSGTAFALLTLSGKVLNHTGPSKEK